MQSRTRSIESWEDFCTFLEERPKGTGEFAWLRSWAILPENKSIAISSLMNSLVAPYFSAYNLATAEFTRGYIWGVDFNSHPAVLIEAFSLIKSEITKAEQARIRQQAREIQRLRDEEKLRHNGGR